MSELELKLAYKPNPKQTEFHGLSAKYRGFCGGWGNGKTSAGCAEFFISLMEFPGTRAIVARKTRPELRTTTWDMLLNGDVQPTGWRGIPRPLIEVYNKSDLYVRLRNGSEIHGLPLDDPKKLENYNLGLFMVDQAEEIDDEILLKFQGRLRQHDAPREGLYLFNPNGHNFLWRRFIDPRRDPKIMELYKCVEATPFDNPNLPADYMDQFASLPKHWYDRYVLGSHEVFVGQIFVDFDPDTHVIPPFHIPPDWERWCCIDPGIGHEGAVTWVARDYENNLYYYREIVAAGQPVSWWAEAIQRAESSPNGWGGPDEEMFARLIGPESQQRSQTDGRTVKGVFEEEGVDDLEVADKDPLARINRITQSLRPVPGHHNPVDDSQVMCYDHDGQPVGLGAPKLYFFSDLEYTLEHFPQYRWRPTRVTYSDETAPEKPRKKDDHTVDNLGHILVSMGDSVPYAPTNERPRTREEMFYQDHFEQALLEAQANSEVTLDTLWSHRPHTPLVGASNQ